MANPLALQDIQAARTLDQIYGAIAKHWSVLRRKTGYDAQVLTELYKVILRHEGWKQDGWGIQIRGVAGLVTDTFEHSHSRPDFPEDVYSGERLQLTPSTAMVERLLANSANVWDVYTVYRLGSRARRAWLEGRDLLDLWLYHEQDNIRNGVLPGAVALRTILNAKAATKAKIQATRKRSSADYACLAYLCRLLTLQKGWQWVTTTQRLFASTNPLSKEILWAAMDLEGHHLGAFFWANGEWTSHKGDPINTRAEMLVGPVSPAKTPFGILEQLKQTVDDFKWVPSSGLPQLAYVGSMGSVRIEPWMRVPKLPEYDTRSNYVDDMGDSKPNAFATRYSTTHNPNFYEGLAEWVQRGGHLRPMKAGTVATGVAYGIGAPPPGAQLGKWSADDLKNFAIQEIPNPPVLYRYNRMASDEASAYLES